MAVVDERTSYPVGVAMPFNGTRRWYLSTFDKTPDDLYTSDYPYQVRQQMRHIMGMMFADGVRAIYTPVLSQGMAKRGEQYMRFAAMAAGELANDEDMAWYLDQGVAASAYGALHLLPQDIQDRLEDMRIRTHTPHARRYLRFGVLAAQPVDDLIAATLNLYHAEGTEPTAQTLLEHYYHGPRIDVSIWIGSDQPTVYDVPFLITGQTALYFLQFLSLHLDQATWRRILWDYLFVRSDTGSLHPDAISDQRQVLGLGTRRDGHWTLE